MWLQIWLWSVMVLGGFLAGLKVSEFMRRRLIAVQQERIEGLEAALEMRRALTPRTEQGVYNVCVGDTLCVQNHNADVDLYVTSGAASLQVSFK